MDWLQMVRRRAKERIDMMAAKGNGPMASLDYHRWQHTEEVEERFGHLCDAVRRAGSHLISEENELAGRAAAYAHDVDQSCVYVPGPNGLMRKRFTGLIEASSAMWLLAMLEEMEAPVTVPQKEVMVEAILATVPEWDRVKNRLTQPNLKPGVRLTSVLLAIADLGGGVMDGRKFAREGREVMREDHLYIRQAICDADGGLPRNTKILADIMVGYLGGQMAFLQAVEDRLGQEILPLVVLEVREPIRGVCNKAPEARTAALQVYEHASELAGQERYGNLFTFMGYDLKVARAPVLV